MSRTLVARLLCFLVCFLLWSGECPLAAATSTSQGKRSSSVAAAKKKPTTSSFRSQRVSPSLAKAKINSKPQAQPKTATQPKKVTKPGTAGNSKDIRQEGIYHVVRKGENLFRISRAYQVSIDSLIEANHLSRPSALKIGQRLFVPGARLARKVEPFRPLTGKKRGELVQVLMTENEDEAEGSTPGPDSSEKLPAEKTPAEGRVAERAEELPSSSPSLPGSTATGNPSPVQGELADTDGFIWPLVNRITSPFGLRGKRMHNGIDIAAPSYHEVVAAADGEVIFVQHSRKGLGNAVVLQHDHGFQTVYGHGVVILVKAGETVRRGQPIMGVGNTGRSTGNHLHFEIRKDGVAVDPLALLPPTLEDLLQELRAEQKEEGRS
jgi:murein DD-endopeptidase MepM/ murein hydrolase activator NlpD